MIALKGMQGLGDNIYQRAFVKSLARSQEVLLETPWPELYEDLPNLKFLKPHSRLRTQLKNIERVNPAVWAKPYFGHARQISYGDDGMLRGMRRTFGVDCAKFDLPQFESPIQGDYVVVRPATVRKEWIASSRNPRPEYIAECAEELLKRGFRVISVADLDGDKEWAEQPLPAATEQFHKGEFNVRELLGLIRGAKLVVGGIGWMFPAAIAYQVPGWFILGGFGAYNCPENLADAGRMDISKIGYAIPDHFCKCRKGDHNCDKRISGHVEKFAKWLGRFSDLESRKRDGFSSA